MLVSASLSAVQDNFHEYAQQLKYSNADYLHIDLFQTPQMFTEADILQFNTSELPLDVHLIYSEISPALVRLLNQSTAALATLQYETLADVALALEQMRAFNGAVGLAITPQTPLTAIQRHINQLNHVLVMCSEPGISGAQFDARCYGLLQAIRETYPSLKLYADGGIEANIAEKMNRLGVSLIVSGSFLANNIRDLNSNIYRLKYSNEQGISVRRNMLTLSQLPVISPDAIFFDVVHCIHAGKLGIALVVDGQILLGIVTDGDTRRAYLKYERAVFDVLAKDMMNTAPFTAQADITMETLMKQLSTAHPGIKVVPVLEDGVLVGAVNIAAY